MALPLVAEEFWVGTEPELKYTEGSGRGYCRFRIKAVDRQRDESAPTGWRDGDVFWATATVWDGRGANTTAQNVYESVKKGDNVVITGQVYTREKDGRTFVEVKVNKIGPSLTFRTTPHGAGRQGGDNQNDPQPSAHREETVAATSGGSSIEDPPF